MTKSKLDSVLSSAIVLVDTRERETERLKSRLKSMGYQYERVKLDYGDYSVRINIDDRVIDLSNRFSIERKMGLDECCLCFTKERARFEREFQRAKEAGARIYLLIEDASWEKIFLHDYRSKTSPMSLIGSLLSWQIRYNLHIIMCHNKCSGKMIQGIISHEIKEYIREENL